MRKFLLTVGLLVGLAGCGVPSVNPAATGTTTLALPAQVSYAQACAAYSAVFGGVLAMREAGRLNDAQIKQVTLLDTQILPICTGKLPADADAAIQRITAAVTVLTVLEVTQKGS